MMAGNSEPRMKQEPGVKTESDNLNCDSASSVQLNSDLHQNDACPDPAMSVDYVMEVSLASDNEVKTEIESEPNHSPKPTFSQSQSELAQQCGRNSDLNSAIGVCRNSNNVTENKIKGEIKTEPNSPGSSVPDPGHALTECDNVNRSEFEATHHSSRESEVISVALDMLERDIMKQEFSDETNSPTNILNQQTQRPRCDDEFKDPKLKHEKSVSNSVEGNPSGALLKIEVEDPLQRSGHQLVDTGNQEQVSCPDVYDETLGFKQQTPIPVMNVSPLFQQQENPGSVGHPHGFPHPPIIVATTSISSATARGTANSKSFALLRLVRVKRVENNQGSHPSHHGNCTASDSGSRVAHPFPQKQYKCSRSDAAFATTGERLEHQHQVHAIENPLPRGITIKKSYDCQHCKKGFSLQSLCLNHEKWCANHVTEVVGASLQKHTQVDNKESSKLQHEHRVHTQKSIVPDEKILVYLYECQHCKKGFNLQRHYLKHEKLCGNPVTEDEDKDKEETNRKHQHKSSTDKSKLLGHKDFMYKCQHCKKGYNLKRHYLKHEKLCGNQGSHPSHHSNCTASDSGSRVAHESTCTFSQKQYKCSRSDAVFATTGERLEHQHEAHAIENPLPRGVKSYECQHCKKGFSLQSLCLNHEKLCANHVTEVVGASLQKHTQVDNKESSKLQHEHRVHTQKSVVPNEKILVYLYECQHCKKGFNLQRHYLKHEKLCGNNPVTKDKDKEGTNRKHQHKSSDKSNLLGHKDFMYKCQHCKKGYNLERHYLKHEKLCGNNPATKDKDKERTNRKHQHKSSTDRSKLLGHKDYMYECQHCKKGFNLQGHYLIHEKLCGNPATRDKDKDKEGTNRKHHQVFKCYSCKESFKDMARLHEHFATCTLAINSKVIHCNYCNKVFKLKESHRKHELLHEKHNGVELHKCKYCNKMFTSDSIGQHELEHKCKICGKSFRNKGYMYSKAHILTHTVEKPLTCKQCGKHFKSERGLQLHELIHSGVKPHQCRFCDQTFRLNTTRLFHEQVHTGKRHKCQLCEKSFKYKSSLVGHQFVHTGEKPHQCKHCDKAFADRSALRRHELLHSGIKPHQCRFCDKTFRLNSTRRYHEQVHTGEHGERPHKCQLCEKSFKSKVSLVGHQLVHTGEKPHQCKHCDKAYADRSALRRHEVLHSGIKPHQCRFCDKTFNNRVSLCRHELVHTGERPYKCERCDSKSYRRKESLLRHQLVHTGEKPHQCEQCDKAYADRSALCRHEIVHSGLRKPHQCRFCDTPFNKRWSLRKHELVHTGERPHKCELCDKSYRRKESLLRHQLVHTGEKPHQCEHCDKAYAHKSNLRQHELSHSVLCSKPLQCRFCDKTFASRTGFRKHEIFHTGAGTHNCEQCERTFINNSTLQRHMLVHTGKKPHLCIHCGMGFKYKDLLRKHELQHTTCSSPGSHVEEGPTEKPVNEILHPGEKIQEAD